VTADVTVIIPHFRARVLVECLESLFLNSDPPVQVIVVDDGGNAPSLRAAAARFPGIRILRNERNLGFSGSCNRGLQAVSTPYAVLLNDDTRVAAGWLPPLVQAAQANPLVAACQPKLLSAADPGRFDYGGGAGGYIDHLGFTFCRGRVFSHRERDQGQYDREVAVFWACGSALFLRMAALRRVGLLDVGFFMHFEEIDLCWRLRLAGYDVRAVPRSVVFHHSGYSLPPRSFRKSYLNHRNNLVMLIKNMDPIPLCRVLLLRLALEFIAVPLYLARREWSSAPAPLAGILWIFLHPLDLFRRRRASRRLRSPRGRLSARLRGPGTYGGSLTWAYFVRGIRRASELVPEETSA